MAAHHLTVGEVLFANEDTILISDGTLFLIPAGMRLLTIAGTTLVIEYEILLRGATS
jgi:hypothetical protein